METLKPGMVIACPGRPRRFLVVDVDRENSPVVQALDTQCSDLWRLPSWRLLHQLGYRVELGSLLEDDNA